MNSVKTGCNAEIIVQKLMAAIWQRWQWEMYSRGDVYFLDTLLEVVQWVNLAWMMPWYAVVHHCCNSFSNFCVMTERREFYPCVHDPAQLPLFLPSLIHFDHNFAYWFCCSMPSRRYLSITFQHSTHSHT